MTVLFFYSAIFVIEGRNNLPLLHPTYIQSFSPCHQLHPDLGILR